MKIYFKCKIQGKKMVIYFFKMQKYVIYTVDNTLIYIILNCLKNFKLFKEFKTCTTNYECTLCIWWSPCIRMAIELIILLSLCLGLKYYFLKDC